MTGHAASGFGPFSTAQVVATLYYLAVAGFGVHGLLALLRLYRLGVRRDPFWQHHLWYGLVAALALPALCGRGWLGFALGAALGLWPEADDAVRHGIQVRDIEDGQPPRPDWGPWHRLGERIVAWWWRVTHREAAR